MDTLESRVIPLTDEGDLWKRHFAGAEMVIEAVPENLDLKHRYIHHIYAQNWTKKWNSVLSSETLFKRCSLAAGVKLSVCRRSAFLRCRTEVPAACLLHAANALVWGS